jgi:hypothetical protein
MAGVELQVEEEEDLIPKVEVEVNRAKKLWNVTNVIN